MRRAESGLRNPVGKEENPVFRLGLKGIGGHGAFAVFGRGKLPPFDRKRPAVPQQQEFRIPHLHNAGHAAEAGVDDGEGRVADLPYLTDRQRIHDDFGGVDDLAVLRAEPQRHRGGHQSEDVRLYSMSQSVRQHRQQPFFGRNPLEGDRIPAGLFLKVAALAEAGVDEEVAGGQIHNGCSSGGGSGGIRVSSA